MLLASIRAVDLLAFVALGLSVAVVALLLVGLGLWLRARRRNAGDDAGYHPGL